MTEYEPGHRVRIIVDTIPGHNRRVATVNTVQHDGDLAIYFGDQDEDEWVYSPGEVEPLLPAGGNQ